MKGKMKKRLAVLCAMVLTVSSLAGGNALTAKAESLGTIGLTQDDVNRLNGSSSVTRTSVHDPSIIKANDGSYYIFGSHMGVSKTTDLQNWTFVTTEDVNSTLFGDVNGNVVSYANAFSTNAMADSLVTIIGADGQEAQVSLGSYDAAAWIGNNTVQGNMWAPDIIYNPTMNKYCMYMSLNGADWNSSVVLLTADAITGPYVYQGPVVFSGFSTVDSSKSFKNTDLELVIGEQDELPAKYQKIADRSWGEYWPHAIDPAVMYDDAGKLWLIYGSWSGGIYMLELDENTGLRDYTVTYASDFDTLGKSVTSDEYFGKKIAGGYYVSGEGPYIEKIGNYYYLFMSYGFYSPEGGYVMRIFRSENPDGPYVDGNGTNAIFSQYLHNYNGVNNMGMKLMGNYKWDTMAKAEIAQGHNSAFVDSDGKAYVIYHTKFNDGTAAHEVRVHQLFTNADGWLVAAPYEYSGETISATGYATDDVVGNYEMILHTYAMDFANLAYNEAETITLNADGTISGAYTGTWSATAGTPYVTLVIGNETYKGVFTEQVVDGSNITVMCFTATSQSGVSIWGSGQPTDDVAVAQTAADNSIIIPAKTLTNLTLPTTGLNGTTITWTSSNTAVLGNDGKVTTPATDTAVTLTKRISKGDYYFEQTYTVTVLAAVDKSQSVVVGSYYTDNAQDLSKHIDASLSVANPFYKGTTQGLDLSGGVTIEFDMTKTGDIHHLGTIFSFMGNQGTDGRLFYTPGSYLGYNALGGFFDANSKDFGLVNDYMGDAAHVAISITPTGFSVTVNDVVAYTEEICSTENGSVMAGFAGYENVLTWLQETADTLYFGYGSFWNAAGYDEANVNLSNVVCSVNPAIIELDTVNYTKDKVELTAANSITYEDNPLYGKNIENLTLKYTINMAEAAAKNGWDGIFSFYNSATNGRVSIQTAPYLCYNNQLAGDAYAWADVNQPGAGGDDLAPSMTPGTEHDVVISLSESGIVMSVDGTSINIAQAGSGATASDIIDFITKCDKLSWGVGQAETAFWSTELCTLTDISFSTLDDVNYSKESVELTASNSISYEDNPFYGKDIENVTLKYTINMAEGTAKNGWDGIFSFYNSTTKGRVSIQTAPYICYNNQLTGTDYAWADINQPGAGGDNVAPSMTAGTDHEVVIAIDSKGITVVVDGEKLALASAGSGATSADIVKFITECDDLSWGVGQAVTAFWNTEICTLKDISFSTEPYVYVSNDNEGNDEEEDEDTPVVNPEITKDTINLSASSITIMDNPFKDATFDTLYVSYTINFAQNAAMNGWDGIFSFYNSTSTGRVSFQTAPYICYNDWAGNWIDINAPGTTSDIVDYGLVPGVDYDVDIIVTKDSVKMYIDGFEIPINENGSGATYEGLLSTVASCDQFSWGVGLAQTALWNTEVCTLKDVLITTKLPATVTTEKASVDLSTNNALTVTDNPYFGQIVDGLYVEYTINFKEVAERGGWDGLFSFYNSATGGRVSFQSTPYICYNDGAGTWFDINNPNLGGDNIAAGSTPGENITFGLAITKDGVTMTANGEALTIAENNSGNVTYADILAYISECDQLTYGVGQGSTAYWWTELCTLSDIKFAPISINVTADGEGTVTGTAHKNTTTITATGDACNEFIGWYVGDILIGTNSTMNISACKNLNIVGKFENIWTNVTDSLEDIDSIEDATEALEEIIELSTEILSTPENMEKLEEIEETLKTSLGTVVNVVKQAATLDIAEIVNALISVPEGGTIEANVATVPTTLPSNMSNKQLKNAAAVDLKLYNAGGTNVQLQVPVKLRFTIPATLDTSKDMVLLHYSDNGSVEKLDFTMDGNEIVATTASFSTFVLANVEDKPVTPNPGTPSGGSTTPSTPATPSAPATPSEPSVPSAESPIVEEEKGTVIDTPITGGTSIDIPPMVIIPDSSEELEDIWEDLLDEDITPSETPSEEIEADEPTDSDSDTGINDSASANDKDTASSEVEKPADNKPAAAIITNNNNDGSIWPIVAVIGLLIVALGIVIGYMHFTKKDVQ